MIALRALGALLTYPRAELIAALPEIGDVVGACPELGAREKERLGALLTELSERDPYELEERYVELFDRTRALSLHLFEHVHGDSRERGQAMVDLQSIYRRAGFELVSNELPDYLPAMLEFLSCRPLAEARDMLGDCAHVLRVIGQRLLTDGSRYAAVFDALLAIASQPGLDWSAAPRREEHADNLDEEWMEAPAFGPGAPAGGAPPMRRGGEAPLRYMPRRTR